jgi:hypothetical protein
VEGSPVTTTDEPKVLRPQPITAEPYPADRTENWRSERPAFEAHYPHMIERLQAEAHAGRRTRSDRQPAAATVASLLAREDSRDPDPGPDGAR